MTLRIPFLVLLLARLMVPRATWQEMKLNAELWDVLQNDEGSAVGNWLTGMRFSISMVMGGAIRTAKAWELPGRARRRTAPARVKRQRPGGFSVYRLAAPVAAAATTALNIFVASDNSARVYLYWTIAALATVGAALVVRDVRRSRSRKRE
ncbi:hypothetical protein [Streptomyces sp. NPDC050392]|uniref:hypothetical protein n=1 Tax=Streptomyces sp. NPDC050392 TaxID=3155782 RepID=UPI003436C9DC